MNSTRVLIVFLVFCGVMVPLAFGKAPAFQEKRAKAAELSAQADSLDRENRGIPVVEAQIKAYEEKMVAGLHGVSSRRAPDTLEADTLHLAHNHHVEFDKGLLRGPLPTPQPIIAANSGPGAVPTPPPPPNTSGGSAIATPMPIASSTPVPGFYRAANLATDPLARRLVAFSGSTDIIGSYVDVIGALQDLSRGNSLVHVVSASICRDDHDTRGLRTLSVAFRLYGLTEGRLQ